MAILHRATLHPSKPELIAAWLDREPGGGSGELEVLGSYRFDDPAGEVGVEAFLVRRGETVLHLPLTYRDRPLDDGVLVGTTEHLVLGTRYVYDGRTDPVARACFLRALRGEQEQAEMELWDGDTLVGRPDPSVRLALDPASAAGADGAVAITRDVSQARAGSARLVARWEGGQAVVASYT